MSNTILRPTTIKRGDAVGLWHVHDRRRRHRDLRPSGRPSSASSRCCRAATSRCSCRSPDETADAPIGADGAPVAVELDQAHSSPCRAPPPRRCGHSSSSSDRHRRWRSSPSSAALVVARWNVAAAASFSRTNTVLVILRASCGLARVVLGAILRQHGRRTAPSRCSATTRIDNVIYSIEPFAARSSRPSSRPARHRVRGRRAPAARHRGPRLMSPAEPDEAIRRALPARRTARVTRA